MTTSCRSCSRVRLLTSIKLKQVVSPLVIRVGLQIERPLLVIAHENVRSFAVLHRVDRVFFGINPNDDLLSGPLPSWRAEVRNPMMGIVPGGLVDAGDQNIGHSGFLRLTGA